MEYKQILGYGIAVIFSWMFVSLNSSIQFARQAKRPRFFIYSLYTSMIFAFIGLVLTLKDTYLAISFAPYVLASSALVHTAANVGFLKHTTAEKAEGWQEAKLSFYKRLVISLIISSIIMFASGIKNEYGHVVRNRSIETKIDTMTREIKKNRVITEEGFQEVKSEAATVKTDLGKRIDKVDETVKKETKEKKKQTKVLGSISKKAAATKKDTELIIDKVDEEPEPTPRRKFLGIF